MTEFIEVKTAELIGVALSWAVADATGADDAKVTSTGSVCCIYKMSCGSGCWTAYYEPSTDWSQGGPLIDEYKPWLSPPVGNDQDDEPYGWDAEIYSADGFEQLSHIIGAPTALIAACRAIVAAKLGETVRVPVELMK
jgi:hypothetical protein